MENLKLYTRQEIVNMMFDTFTEMAQPVYDAKGNMDYETFYKISITIVRFKSSMLEKLGFSKEDIDELINIWKQSRNRAKTN